MKKLFIYFLIFLTIITTVSAQNGHTTLLAVSEDGTQGTKADLFVEIKPGTGKIFLETIPLTKLDTQLSTRFAQQIACNFIKKDCSKKDFFYTIRSDAAIVGGPSAGAAIAATTAALLDNKIIKQDITMTGTINAGGIIGNVGSVREKVLLARTENISTVLIPLGSRYQYDNTTNTTIDLYSLGNDLAMNITEVSTLADVLTALTGKNYHQNYGKIVVDESYKKIMKAIAADLCNRTVQLKTDTQQKDAQQYIQGLNHTYQAMRAFENRQYYTAASRCFAANLQFSFLFLNQTNMTLGQLHNVTRSLQEEGGKFSLYLDQRPLETLTDLQVYVVVKERMDEAKEGLQVLTKLSENATAVNDAQMQVLAFVNERLYTAKAWSTFFNTGTEKITLNNELLKEACAKKLSELQERFQFLEVLAGVPLLQKAKEVYAVDQQREKGNYKLCLYMASKQKAELDYTLAVASTSKEKLDIIVQQRLDVAEQEISKQLQKFFPILGYSYYEYAAYLKENDPYSSLLFAQYSLELSHIDVYFHEELQESRWYTFFENIQVYLTKETFFLLSTGFFLGVFFTLLLLKRVVK